MTFNKPCLSCGKVTRTSRCATCQTEHERVKSAGREPRAHYAGDYRKRAKVVRDTAVACWICGEGWRDGDPWQADHVRQGDPASPLAPAHRTCNIARSNQRNKN